MPHQYGYNSTVSSAHHICRLFMTRSKDNADSTVTSIQVVQPRKHNSMPKRGKAYFFYPSIQTQDTIMSFICSMITRYKMIRTGRLWWLGHLSRMHKPDTDPCRKLLDLNQKACHWASYSIERELYPRWSSWGVKLTPHLHLVSRLCMSGAISSLAICPHGMPTGNCSVFIIKLTCSLPPEAAAAFPHWFC